ncbi:hypothetical protein B932_3077 [Gluconobacter oxydans H24]|nr:hypothetical protein B932_2984 [Gluconobacter oxydans H24]AFW02622.1 hypothetical protein B932_3077 [Gluconobacter oxydans H24]
MTVSALRGHFKALRSDNPDVILPHQLSHTALFGRKATSSEFLCHAGTSVASPALRVNGADMDH